LQLNRVSGESSGDNQGTHGYPGLGHRDLLLVETQPMLGPVKAALFGGVLLGAELSDLDNQRAPGFIPPSDPYTLLIRSCCLVRRLLFQARAIETHRFETR
jgi:hypothetical protein